MLVHIPLRTSAIALGAALVALVVLATASHSGQGPPQTLAAIKTIRVGDVYFCDTAGSIPCTQPQDVTINIGDTVTWEWGPGGAGTSVPHTTTQCADNYTNCSAPREWNTGIAQQSGTFSHTFGPEDEATTFLYRCEVHPIQMFGSITVAFSGDDDSDGLSNAREAALGTNPANPDTDGEGLTDGAEVDTHGTDPLDPDTDADSFDDFREVSMGTSPLLACPATTDPNDETVDAWPPDFDDTRTVNISDVLALKPVFGTSAPRFDLVASGSVNISDVLAMKMFFGQTCT